MNMDRWLNKVICGDCLEVMREMPDNSIDSFVTDPPYGIDYQSAWRIDKTQLKPKIANDKLPFIWWLYDAYRITKLTGSLLCFCRWDVQDAFKQAIEWAGFTIKSQVIWDRAVHGLGDLEGAYALQHDVVWFATKGLFKFPNHRPQSIVRSPRVDAEKLQHPNEKPVPLMEKLIRDVSVKGQTICDPFLGSGSTAIAAASTGRNYIGIEISPEYAALAQKRIAQETAQQRMFV
jgi:site-specific DNA-methyltransferase (adenine-specific)